MEWVQYGPNSVLLRFAEGVGREAFDQGQVLVTQLNKAPPARLREWVPAFNSILLEFESDQEPPKAMAAWLEKLEGLDLTSRPGEEILRIKEIPVQYDGVDLERVAQMHGLQSVEVIQRHAAPIYRVYMLGFSPGFAYLGDLDPLLQTPRMSSPRSKVPAGSVAIGGIHTGIYPSESPGGWNLIGRTNLRLFDPKATSAEEMFYLHYGDSVRFVPV